MHLTEYDLRNLCYDVFSRIGAVRKESGNVFQVTTGEKRYFVGICKNLNMSWESIRELGFDNVCLISGNSDGEANVWSSSELIDFYIEKMYLGETKGEHKPLV